MSKLLLLSLAETTGFPWINLFWMLVGASLTLILFVFTDARNWLMVPRQKPTPPDLTPPVAPAAAPEVISVPVVSAPNALDAEVVAIISAAVHLTLGASAYVTSVSLQAEPSVSLGANMLTWSLEGRRQIYTSHKVR